MVFSIKNNARNNNHVKDTSKSLFDALQRMRENSDRVMDDSNPSNSTTHWRQHRTLAYYQAEQEAILAQEEIGRKNKTILRKEAKGNPFLEERLKRGELTS